MTTAPLPDTGLIGVIRLGRCPVDVEMGEIGWSAWYEWEHGLLTWVDGSLVANGQRLNIQIDVGCLGDDDTRAEWHAPAAAAWEQGSVLAVSPYENCPNVLALIVPTSTLNADLVQTALSRFHP